MEIKKVAIIGLGALSDAGKPSMRQDIEAKRPIEVALFSGMVGGTWAKVWHQDPGKCHAL
ncbi:MAG: hypothetical protein CVU99_04815 [Firmicutes bacterium HGW-Firmicutes-4]|jgi:hypothetical protein|nr:MAG: hypothetical protein CVU99_04815 [Firmicutes bacterium HGW-Firmicutes-4]